MRTSFQILAALPLLVLAGCVSAARGVPQPDVATDRWRALLGCYDLGGGQVVLDSAADRKVTREPGIRVARFVPRPIVGGYWFVTPRGVLWLSRHDGLWGRTWELRVRGDSLVGQSRVRTDVPGRETPAEPAVAVRAAACAVPPADSAAR